MITIHNHLYFNAVANRRLTPMEAAEAMLAIDNARTWKGILCRLVGHLPPVKFLVHSYRYREMCPRCGRLLSEMLNLDKE